VCIFLYNSTTGALHGNNLVSLYQLSFVYIGQNWVDQCHRLQVSKLK